MQKTAEREKIRETAPVHAPARQPLSRPFGESRSGAGLDPLHTVLNRSARVQGLAQLQRSLEGSPRLTALLQLSARLRRATGGRALRHPSGIEPLSGSPPPAVVQRLGTMFTDALSTATPTYLRELSSLDAPGLWDYTDAGAFAVSHKGRKRALGTDAATYSPAILTTKERTKWGGLGSYHFSREIDLSNLQLKTDLYGRDCSNAAEYLMHYKRGEVLSHPGTPVRGQQEKTQHLNADYNVATQRPNVLPVNVPAHVKGPNAQADIGEAYCIVSEPGSGQYNFHYGCVAAQRGAEVLTVEGFATGSATTPDWSFNAYDSTSTFHQVWAPHMTKTTPPFTPGYPFTFVATLV